LVNSTAIVVSFYPLTSCLDHSSLRWFPGYRLETLVTERGGREIGKFLNGLTRWEIRADVSDVLIQ
jgi:hypothetical protein